MAQKFPSESDYLFIHEGCWALMKDYCWDSPSSLYTFRETIALHGSARDYHAFRFRLPRIHPVLPLCYHKGDPFLSPVRLPISPPGLILLNCLAFTPSLLCCNAQLS